MKSAEFKILMSEVYSSMIEIAYGILHDEMEAQDVVQDVATKLWHAPRHLDRADNPHAYCIMAVRNAAVSRQRSARRFENIEKVGQIADRQPPDDETEFVEHLIDSLPTPQQVVVRLRIMGGMDYDLIASRLGLSMGNVRQLLSRARKELRKRYGENN